MESRNCSIFMRIRNCTCLLNTYELDYTTGNSYGSIYNQFDICNFLVLFLPYLHGFLGSGVGAQPLLYGQVGLRITM